MPWRIYISIETLFGLSCYDPIKTTTCDSKGENGHYGFADDAHLYFVFQIYII